jgi:hypothetical protein
MIHDSHQTQTAFCSLDRKNRSSGWLNEETKQFNVWYNVSMKKFRNKQAMYRRWSTRRQNPLFTISIFSVQRDDLKSAIGEVPYNSKCVFYSWGLSPASGIFGEACSRKMKRSSTALFWAALQSSIFGAAVSQQDNGDSRWNLIFKKITSINLDQFFGACKGR